MGLRHLVLPVLIALLSLAVHIYVATSMSETADEAVHVAYGLSVLHGSPDRESGQFDSKMPVSALNALPRAVAISLEIRHLAPGLASFLRGMRPTRYATVAVAFCLSLLVYFYAESLYGRAAGLFAQSLLAMDPNLIAHSTLATTDLYIACGVVLSLYCLRRFLLAPGMWTAALMGATLALAQLTKFTAAYLYFVAGAALLLFALYTRQDRRRMTGFLAVALVCFLFVLNAGFLFDRTFTPLSRYQFRTASLQALQKIRVLGALPLPLPYPYLQGFDWMSYNNSTGLSFGNIVLLGEVRGPDMPRSDGFPSYYLVAYAMKEPLAMQLLLLLGLVWIARRRKLPELLAGEGLLLFTAALFLIMLSLFSKTQIGIRHILPVLALFAILSGGAFASWTQFSTRRKLLLCACVLYAAVSVGSYFPHMIPYFNEILTDRKQAYRYLADSNLDWGQDNDLVARYLKSNPDVVVDPEHRTPGRILVNANFLAGVWPRKADYFMRFEGLQPVAQVGYAHLLFVVPAKR